ncbi:hypothetical protein NDU88_003921 [Pleurodeles waltl]|uniref:Uncharacterized protein n=1 Tax=Pleurodeles waltl TaxID=8319 RepID=A0AAV7VIG8_PLEWA|nr:hypothetical protein NDU88_003921 [Pleurodeles waltl]
MEIGQPFLKPASGNNKGSMIIAAAGSYSVTRNSSHFKEVRMSDDEEEEIWPSAGRKTTSADAEGSVDTALSTRDSHPRAEDKSEDIG